VDTGVVVCTASSASSAAPEQVSGEGVVECRFPRLPLRPRQYVLRLSILDHLQMAAYDLVTAGPRFAVTEQGAGVDTLVDEQDGLVTLPFEFLYCEQTTTRS